MVVFETKKASQTRKLGEEFAKELLLGWGRRRLTKRSIRRFGLRTRRGGRTNLALYGELGSGKTTFIKGLAAGLGIRRRITSPTFVLVRSYPFGKDRILYHLDLYRVSGRSGVKSTIVEEILADASGLVAVEWAENLDGSLPQELLKIRFSYTPSGRQIEFFST